MNHNHLDIHLTHQNNTEDILAPNSRFYSKIQMMSVFIGKISLTDTRWKLSPMSKEGVMTFSLSIDYWQKYNAAHLITISGDGSVRWTVSHASEKKSKQRDSQLKNGRVNDFWYSALVSSTGAIKLSFFTSIFQRLRPLCLLQYTVKAKR